MSNTGGSEAPVPETEVLIQRVANMVVGARALPLSSSVKLDNRDEILDLLKEAAQRLPEELRQARWMLKEREEFLATTQRKAEELVEAARSEAQRLVQRTEILKEAQAQARRAVDEAGEEARRLRLEAEDYADQKLAQFEIVLERTLKTVASGRQKLSGAHGKDEDAAGGTVDGQGRPVPAGSRSAVSDGRNAGSDVAGRSGGGNGGEGKRRLGGLYSARRASAAGEVPGEGGAGTGGAGTGGRRGGGAAGTRVVGTGAVGTGAVGTGAVGAVAPTVEDDLWPDDGLFDQDAAR
jgi:vacuolar-type H+-ATPase subunit H